ncbi:MAG: YifB family Mg chelatase-like AAA ATPase [Clostridium sp.]|nr:YifB family Mg chelatase-like AAA ATPase [Clostridium sp.]MCM1547839.1 YifB family Mg chelatase-like AAA ATPase [Ruminococcus sp.]
MFSKVNSLGLFGLNAFKVDVEIEISRGIPIFDIVGLPDMVVKESRERIKASMRSCDFEFPVARVMVNLAPAGTRKSGSVHDMAIFMAVMKAAGYINADLDSCCFIGELSLDGSLRPIDGVLPMTLLAKEEGFNAVFVPVENAYEASVSDGIEVYGVSDIRQLVEHFTSGKKIALTEKYVPKANLCDYALDFSDVKGQHSAKTALEIAAAGGHNALLIGTPGSGKSMLAKRMPSILPDMTLEESIETTKIHSISGMLDPDAPLVTVRPFRSPHHTISSAGLAGGGSVPRPGEISIAHNGLLFLDELAEFDRRTLEILRQPLEDGKVTISRAAGTVVYPSSIMLIAAMNPCPCGYYGHPSGRCRCTHKQVSAYLSKISGPMLDRFDLHIEVAPVEFNDISSDKKEESSAEIRKRVSAARDIQNERFRGTSISCNAQITPDKLNGYCPMDDKAKSFIGKAFDRLGLSARAYDRILKVSRTIADLYGSEKIEKEYISAAIQLRSLDRKYWSGEEQKK